MSATCHTTTLAISMGLPILSLTFRISPFSVRARTEILVERLDDALVATLICLLSERLDLLSTSAVASSAELFEPMERL